MGKPRTKAHFLVNRFANHRQDFVRNFKHIVRRRDVVCEIGDHFLVTNAARFELTSRDEIVAMKDLGHVELLKTNSKLTSDLELKVGDRPEC